MLDKVDYLWLSHEHPDHCHFPTLDSFPAAFKARVTVLFQDRDYTKVFGALRKLGYQRFKRLPHRVVVPLSDKPDATKVYCYHAGLMDSALAVLSQWQVIFNANDARISVGECKGILDDVGHVDVLLNQFSLAAYAGFEPHEKYLAATSEADSRECLVGASRAGCEGHDPVRELHVLFEPRQQVRQQLCEFRARRSRLFDRVMASARRYFIRETLTRSAPSTIHRTRWRNSTNCRASKSARYDPVESKTMAEIVAAYDSLAANMREKYSMLLLRMLRPVTIRIPDLDKTVVFRLAKGSLEEIDNATEPDLVINSQPLWFGFKFPFGIQTLGVSARFKLLRNFNNWKFHRILFSLNNGGFICARNIC